MFINLCIFLFVLILMEASTQYLLHCMQYKSISVQTWPSVSKSARTPVGSSLALGSNFTLTVILIQENLSAMPVLGDPRQHV